MARFLLLLLVFAPAWNAWGQVEPQWLAGQRLPVQWSLMPTYQQFELNNNQVTEISAPFSLFIPFSQNIGLSARVSGANVEGDALESLAGIGRYPVGPELQYSSWQCQRHAEPGGQSAQREK